MKCRVICICKSRSVSVPEWFVYGIYRKGSVFPARECFATQRAHEDSLKRIHTKMLRFTKKNAKLMNKWRYTCCKLDRQIQIYTYKSLWHRYGSRFTNDSMYLCIVFYTYETVLVPNSLHNTQRWVYCSHAHRDNMFPLPTLYTDSKNIR